jgi:hypothetical protein
VKPSRLIRETGGVVYVEFIISFIPVFVLFLGIVQLVFMAAAKLVVQHAAVMGARSAIVVLEDDHEEYGGEGFGVIDYEGSTGGSSRMAQNIRDIGSWFGRGGDSPFGQPLSTRGGPRLQNIRWAVYVPLLAVSPPPGQVSRWFGLAPGSFRADTGSHESLEDAIGRAPWLRFASGLMYNRAATAVTFHPEPGSKALVEGPIGPTEEVTIRVTYLFPCSVPIVSRFMCDQLLGTIGIEKTIHEYEEMVRNKGLSDPDLARRLEKNIKAKLKKLGKNIAVLRHAEYFGLTMVLAATGGRFAILSAEATLSNQGAGYYRDRGDG